MYSGNFENVLCVCIDGTVSTKKCEMFLVICDFTDKISIWELTGNSQCWVHMECFEYTNKMKIFELFVGNFVLCCKWFASNGLVSYIIDSNITATKLRRNILGILHIEYSY